MTKDTSIIVIYIVGLIQLKPEGARPHPAMRWPFLGILQENVNTLCASTAEEAALDERYMLLLLLKRHTTSGVYSTFRQRFFLGHPNFPRGKISVGILATSFGQRFTRVLPT
jgi:hypothetical protein